MKVLLINPPSHHQMKYSIEWDTDIEDVGIFPPLGLMQIAAQLLQDTNHQVKIIDTIVDKMDYATLEKAIVDYAPDVAGITSFTFSFYDLMETVKLVKKVDQKIHVCVGGPHTAIFGKETAAKPEIDSVVLGEGEYVFIQLLQALEENRGLNTVKGLIIKDNDTGEIVQTGEPGFIKNLDELPFPAFHLVPFRRYYSSVGTSNSTGVICSSRGCPFQCTFCQNVNRKYRIRSMEHILLEIMAYHDQGVNEFFFFDDLFNITTRRVEEFSQMLLDKNLDISWIFRGRVDQISENMLKIAKKSGCRLISIGAEDYTDEGLKFIKKKIMIKDVENAVSLIKKAGIECSTNWIIGLPHHKTKEDIFDMLKFIKRLDPDYAEIGALIPFYNTEIYEEGIRRGVLAPGVWEGFVTNPTKNFLIPAWEEHFSREELSKLRKMCHEKFYFRPQYILKRLVRVRSFAEFWMKARVAIKMLG